MKTKSIFIVMTMLCIAFQVQAQSSKCDMSCKKEKVKKIKKRIGLDLGINAWVDRTQYSNLSDPGLVASHPELYTGITQNDFNLRTNKSWNINLWPFLYDIKLLDKDLNLRTGLGFQIYNYRLASNTGIGFVSTNTNYPNGATTPNMYKSWLTVVVEKNKLGITYLSTPLILQYTPKIGKRRMLIGGGLIAGYKIKTWTKEKLSSDSKTKEKSIRNIRDYNLNLEGEFGIKDKIIVYGTYSLTNLYKEDLNFQPYCIGLKLIN